MSHAHDAHHDDHPPFLDHHWETPQQQFEAGKLGMWLFLATEVLLFGGLFVGYAVWRGNNPDLFRYGEHYLSVNMGALNTVVLILSSVTVALAVTYAQLNKQRAMIACLLITLAFAGTFMVVKYFEYSEKYREGILPGPAFYNPPPDLEKSKYWVEGRPIIGPAELSQVRARVAAAEGDMVEAERLLPDPDDRELPAMAERSVVELAAMGPAGFTLDPAKAGYKRGEKAKVHPLQDPDRPVNAHGFFNLYFMMTGLHGIHVLAGMVVITWLIVRSFKGHFSSAYYTPIDLGALYWHIVDLIWIFLFPLFYLI